MFLLNKDVSFVILQNSIKMKLYEKSNICHKLIIVRC